MVKCLYAITLYILKCCTYLLNLGPPSLGWSAEALTTKSGPVTRPLCCANVRVIRKVTKVTILRALLTLSPLTEAVYLVASLFRFAHKQAVKALRKVPRTFLFLQKLSTHWIFYRFTQKYLNESCESVFTLSHPIPPQLGRAFRASARGWWRSRLGISFPRQTVRQQQ